MHDALLGAIALLLAAIVCVPLARRLRLGTVVGYLLAGLLVGPQVLAVVSEVELLAHVSELGVVLLMFVIGLELQPARLWLLRRPIIGLGGAQMLTATTLIGGFALLVPELSAPGALVVGLALAMSSTALVLQLLDEHKLTNGRLGRDAFAVLLLQDLVAAPILALIPLLGAAQASGGGQWSALGLAVVTIAAVLVASRYLIRPLFRLVVLNAPVEIFTATALLLALGTAWLMDAVGLSMTLGAFFAGVLLAGSEYRHELESRVEPFKGLLLGLFFMAVGMGLDLDLAPAQLGQVLLLTLALLALKIACIALIGMVAGRGWRASLRLGTMLAQGGEFGFVILALGVGLGLLSTSLAAVLTLVVGLSMAVTPALNALVGWLTRRPVPEPVYDAPDDDSHPVLIAGFGRIGQIIGRILRLRGFGFTAIEIHPDQVDRVRRFGTKIYYGDASREDLLRAAGAGGAKVAIVTLSDPQSSLAIVDTLQRHFPNLTVVAAARNRQHEIRLRDRGVTHVLREKLESSLALSAAVLQLLGFEPLEAAATVNRFRDHDAKTLEHQRAVHHDEKLMIQTQREMSRELEALFEADNPAEAVPTDKDVPPMSGVPD